MIERRDFIAGMLAGAGFTALASAAQHLVKGPVEGIWAFSHPYGCSQTGADHARTRRLLASLCHHPNAGGILILGLGCENLTIEQFRAEIGAVDPKRVKFLVSQDVEDEIAEGMCSVKNMGTGEQVKLTPADAAAHIKATLEAGDCAVILEK